MDIMFWYLSIPTVELFSYSGGGDGGISVSKVLFVIGYLL